MHATSHELFGFDIMLESDLKPYLIEVNISPSMASSSQLDRDIKGELTGRMIIPLYRTSLPCSVV
jgi:tubulin polyglutamylase TTLL4